jgi:hypothetical protein
MNRLPRRRRYALYLVVGLLLATGAAWAGLHYLPGWFGLEERSARAVNAVLMKIHGAAAMLSLLLFGTLLVDHVGTGWRSARNKPSGVAILTLAGTLIVTGYLLYYAGAESTRGAASILHLFVGLVRPVLVCVHALRLVRARQRRSARWRAMRRARSQAAGHDPHRPLAKAERQVP